MRKYIYIITLIDNTQFKATKFEDIVSPLNEYCKTNNLVDLNNQIYQFNKYTLKNRYFKHAKVTYPFKQIQKILIEDYFQKELIELCPEYFNKCFNTKHKYLTKLLQDKNII